jgi:lipopolysaccharide export LptBFGC system permease protein LptF
LQQASDATGFTKSSLDATRQQHWFRASGMTILRVLSIFVVPAGFLGAVTATFRPCVSERHA